MGEFGHLALNVWTRSGVNLSENAMEDGLIACVPEAGSMSNLG